MLTGYLSTLPTDCLLSAGVLFYTRSGVTTRVGVTDGAPDFDPGVEEGEIMFDNRAPSRLKGLSRRVGFAPVFKGVLKELGPVASGGQIALLEPGVSEATVSGTTTETTKAAGQVFAAGDYIVDFRWVFERASGGYAAIYAPLAIVRKWTHKGVDKKEAQISFEIEAIGDPVNDLGTAPYAIEIRTGLPVALSIPLSHTFTGVDSSSSPGAADTGQAASVLWGTWGRSSNRAALITDAGSNENAVVWDAGVSDCTVKVTFAVAEDQQRLIWRAVDVDNYFMLQALAGVLQVYRRQTGSFNPVTTSPASPSYTPVNGDVVSVVLSGSSITVKVNGTTLCTASDSFQSSATKCGIGINNSTTARWDDLTVSVP